MVTNPEMKYKSKTVREVTGHTLNTCPKFSEKLTLLTPWYAYVFNGWPLIEG